MRIKNINWISVEGLEAELEIEVESWSFIAFMHPCTVEVGTCISFMNAFFVSNLMLESDHEASFIKNINGFECYCIGKLLHVESKTLDIFGVEVEVDADLPNDAKVGSFYSFYCDRLEL